MSKFANVGVAVLSVIPFCFAPALAAEMHGNMMADSMHVTCKSMGMSDAGMMMEFHNMGTSEIPAGTKVHWMMHGMAQGDMNFMDAVAPGKMASQNYMMKDAGHMSADS